MEKLPRLIRALANGADTDLDFYTQGIERELRFYPSGEIARTLGRSASTVSQAITSMRQASLIDDHRRPIVPNLFWELADRWKPLTTLGLGPKD